MINFTTELAAKSETLNSSSFLRLYEHNMMIKLNEWKSNGPKLKQKQISKQLGFSDSTIKRYRDDINLDSPYKGKKYKKKNTQSIISITETQTHTPREIIKKILNSKINEKSNILKRGSI